VSKPAVGTKVLVREGGYQGDPWVAAVVTEHLMMQFMAETESGRVVFGVYTWEGESWKKDR